MTTKILVTGAGALLGQGIIRSLRQSNLNFEIIAVDPARLSVGLYWADRGYIVPLATDPSYIDRLRYILSVERPDIIMIGTDVEKKLFAERRAEFQEEFGARTLVSTPNVIAIADDKYATYNFLHDAGFHPPASVLPGEEHYLIAQVGFPLVVKPRVGGRSRGVRVVQNRTELDSALACDDNLVLQECVGRPDMEFTAGVVHFPEQEVVSIVMRRDLRDGNTYRAYVDLSTELNQQVVALAKALKPYGPVNFQFRVDSRRAGARV